MFKKTLGVLVLAGTLLGGSMSANIVAAKTSTKKIPVKVAQTKTPAAAKAKAKTKTVAKKKSAGKVSMAKATKSAAKATSKTAKKTKKVAKKSNTLAQAKVSKSTPTKAKTTKVAKAHKAKKKTAASTGATSSVGSSPVTDPNQPAVSADSGSSDLVAIADQIGQDLADQIQPDIQAADPNSCSNYQ